MFFYNKHNKTSSKMDEGTHNSIFNAVISVSRTTGVPPRLLVMKILKLLPRSSEDITYDHDVLLWMDSFKSEMRSISKYVRWYEARKLLEFYVSNVRIFYDKSLHKTLTYEKNPIDMSLDEIIEKKDAFNEKEIERLQKRVMCMEKKKRSRERGFGKEEPITRFQTAPDFWVTQFNEEVDFAKNSDQGTTTQTPPKPNWLRLQQKKEREKKQSRWRNLCKPSVGEGYYQGMMDRRREVYSNNNGILNRYTPPSREQRSLVYNNPPTRSERDLGESILREIQEERREGNGGKYHITEKSAKTHLTELQNIIDEKVKNTVTDGVYLELCNEMAKAFKLSK